MRPSSGSQSTHAQLNPPNPHSPALLTLKSKRFSPNLKLPLMTAACR